MNYSKKKEEALKLYISGLSSKEISVVINVHRETIAKWVRYAGISRHNGPKSKIGKEDFFDDINSEEKAYYLGWIMADGNVSTHNQQYSLKIHIKETDNILIDNFLYAIRSKNKPQYRINSKGFKSYYISLTSKHMISSLFNLGVIPNKSGKEIMPNINDKLKHHFVEAILMEMVQFIDIIIL